MRNVQNVPKCTGCGACYNACPTGAITMEYTRTKFYAPLIDVDKCINCSKCAKICPALEYQSKNEKPDVYAVAAPDNEADKSTSGGAFYVLAKYVLSLGGYVCGVAWNENWEAKHIIIDHETDLEKLRISKYVQAFTGNVFQQIRNLLKEGKTVLFSGSPCQNAGLKKFLGKDYDNLITVDHLCHGAPSPKIWQEYLEENYDKSAITAVNFRAKGGNWALGTRTCMYNTAHGYIEEHAIRKQIGAYYESFLEHLLSNEACLECKYKFIPRPADFTMGDFWSWRNYLPDYSPEHGISVFLCNNQKAKNLIPKLKSAFKLCRKADLRQRWEDIEITPQSRRKPARTQFWQEYHKGQLPLRKAMNAALHRHYDIAFAGMFNGWNYGSALVSYAAQSILNEMGYTVVMINKRRYPELDLGPDNRSLRFARAHCHITRQYECGEDVTELNNLADTFMVGSDTNWWWGDVHSTGYFYWLDFVWTGKRKIAFSTSFAHERPDIPQAETPVLRYLYSRFDAISVREKSGVRNLGELYGVDDAEHIYDPTLIAEDRVFRSLAAESSRTDSGYVFAYILDPTPEKDKLLREVSARMGLELRAVPGMTVKDLSVVYNERTPEIVDFVYLVSHAEFVITDSFHGTCFSIIFRRPFVSLLNEWRGAARYQTFRDMGFSERLLYHPEEVMAKLDALKAVPDFELSDRIRQREREKALAWLKTAMERKPKVSDASLLYDYMRARQVAASQQIPRRRKAIQKIKNALRRGLPSFMYSGAKRVWKYLRSHSKVVRLLRMLIG